MHKYRLNKYFIRSRIREGKFRELLRCFCEDLNARQSSKFTKLNINTINSIFKKLRKRILEECEKESPLFKGEVEVDESYFGPRRVRGKRGRGASKKIPVFGLLKRGGKVYTQVVANYSRTTLQAINRGKVSLESIMYKFNHILDSN